MAGTQQSVKCYDGRNCQGIFYFTHTCPECWELKGESCLDLETGRCIKRYIILCIINSLHAAQLGRGSGKTL